MKAKDTYRLSKKTRDHQRLNHQSNSVLLSLSTIRLSLSGALLGVAVVGIVANGNHEAIGAFIGGTAVFIAKARHFI